MRRAAVVLVAGVLAGASVAASYPRTDPGKRDLRALQGSWRPQALTVNGAVYPPERHPSRLTFAESAWKEVGGAGGEVVEGIVKLDSTRKPPSIDLVPQRPPGGRVARGIYRLEGDTLTVCMSLREEGNRPKEFASTERSGTALAVYTRVKK
jgi:uncharacterized protein (TIGR03067 family)